MIFELAKMINSNSLVMIQVHKLLNDALALTYEDAIADRIDLFVSRILPILTKIN